MKNKRLGLISIFSKYRVWNFPEKYVKQLNQEFSEFKFLQTKNKSQFLELIPDAEILVSFRFKAEDFQKAKNLKWIHYGGAGVGKIIFEDLMKSDMIVTKSAGINAEAVAEMTWAFILGIAKMIPTWISFKNKGNILADEINFHNTQAIFGKTLGILGLGNIGKQIARKGKAFDMKVIGTRRQADKKVPNVDEVYPPDKIYDVLSQSDYLVVALPITPATRQMIGDKEFQTMKEGIIIINVSRGDIIQEEFLKKYLKSGKIAGAGLDVIQNEPIKKDNELYKIDNVILTPHIAGFHKQYWDRLYKLFRENLTLYLQNKPLKNQINKQYRY